MAAGTPVAAPPKVGALYERELRAKGIGLRMPEAGSGTTRTA